MTGHLTHSPAVQGGTREAIVVVGVDGSACSKAALRWAADYAALTGAELRPVNVWFMPTSYGWALPTDDEGMPALHACKVLESSLDEVFGSERPRNVHHVVVEGHAAGALLAEAEGADLLVVGSRGHGTFAAATLGSVGSYCVRHAPCPVAIIRH